MLFHQVRLREQAVHPRQLHVGVERVDQPESAAEEEVRCGGTGNFSFHRCAHRPDVRELQRCERRVHTPLMVLNEQRVPEQHGQQPDAAGEQHAGA